MNITGHDALHSLLEPSPPHNPVQCILTEMATDTLIFRVSPVDRRRLHSPFDCMYFEDPLAPLACLRGSGAYLQAPTDAQVSSETALAQQITKGQAREIMQKYMPVPETSLHAHCTSLASIGSKHKQMHLQVCDRIALLPKNPVRNGRDMTCSCKKQEEGYDKEVQEVLHGQTVFCSAQALFDQ